ncbi:hypothetical protein RVD_106 [viral metagenome]
MKIFNRSPETNTHLSNACKYLSYGSILVNLIVLTYYHWNKYADNPDIIRGATSLFISAVVLFLEFATITALTEARVRKQILPTKTTEKSFDRVTRIIVTIIMASLGLTSFWYDWSINTFLFQDGSIGAILTTISEVLFYCANLFDHASTLDYHKH